MASVPQRPNPHPTARGMLSSLFSKTNSLPKSVSKFSPTIRPTQLMPTAGRVTTGIMSLIFCLCLSKLVPDSVRYQSHLGNDSLCRYSGCIGKIPDGIKFRKKRLC